jgi:hypothetical protein
MTTDKSQHRNMKQLSLEANSTPKNLKNSGEKEISNTEFKKLIIGKINELKEKTLKLVTELKEYMNKQLTELKENSSR